MIFDIANWLGQAMVPAGIGGSETEGWYSIKDTTLLRWKRGSDEILETQLQWPDYPLAIETSMHGLIGDVLVLGGKKQNNTGPSRIRFADFDASNGQIIPGSEYENGDGQSRWGAGCQTNKGGFVAAVYVDVLPKNTIVLDVFYRCPAAPTIPGTTPPPPKWWYERRSLSATIQSGIYDYLQVVQGPDGLIWIFIMRDSSGTIGLLRYRPTLTGLQYVDDAPEFIPRNLGNLSPSGESPNLAAVVDHRNNRIVLCYQGPSPDNGYSECLKAKYGNGFYSHWSVTEVGMDKRIMSLGATPWWATHAGDEQVVIVARRDGIYFLLPYVNTPENCAEEGCHLGRLVNGVFQIVMTIPRGVVLGRSQDGWCFWMDRTAKPFPITYLMKLRCVPEMSAARDSSSLTVSELLKLPGMASMTVEGASKTIILDWDEGDSRDVLQSSPDAAFSIVAEEYGAGLPPRVVPNNGGNQFFRVKTTT